jgi:hypothetical protein
MIEWCLQLISFNRISYSNWIYFVHTRFLVFLSMFCGVVNNVQKDDKHGHLFENWDESMMKP